MIPPFKILSRCLLIITTCALVGCDNNKIVEKKRVVAAASAAENVLMANPATAGPEIDRRISEWIKVRNDALYVRTKFGQSWFETSVHSTSTPWQASCSRGSLLLTIGLSTGVGDEEITLSSATLSEEQCEIALDIVAKKMNSLTGRK